MASVQPYVFFDGKCDEAIKFYSSAIGAQTQMLMRYKDCPDPQAKAGCKPGTEDKVMHANIKIRDTEVLMADGHCGGQPKFEIMASLRAVIDRSKPGFVEAVVRLAGVGERRAMKNAQMHARSG